MSSTYPSPSEAGFDLLRHVPPKDIEERLFDILDLNPDLTDDLISSVDIPLRTEQDDKGLQFIKCDYNRDGDSYRSPHTNTYYPPIPDGQSIPKNLREIEEAANKGFASFVRLFYGPEAVFSAYCFETPEAEFGFGFFVSKSLSDTTQNGVPVNGWISSSDVFTISKVDKTQFEYSMVSSVLIELQTQVKNADPLVISGGLSSRVSKSLEAKGNIQHLINCGTMIEENAANFFEKIKGYYISKMQEILSNIKITNTINPQDALRDAFMNHNNKK